jgi:solute carrier family 25 (mitochondrial phosphate transporter), member 3
MGLQPGDTLLSKINKSSDLKGSSLQKLTTVARETGFSGLWAGLGTRTLMTCFLVAGQFAIYDELKKLAGAPKGIEIVKADTKSS